MPETMEVSIMPAIIGSISQPDSVTPAPVDICRNVGIIAMAENMPMPRTRPMRVVIVNVRLVNSRSGISGSLARVSATMNAATEASVRTARPDSRQFDQSYPLDESDSQLVSSTMPVVATAIVTMPAQSTGRDDRCDGSLSANHAMANAAMPIGMLSQKAQRQPGPSVSQPPMSGPSTAEMPKSAPSGPMYLPRSDAGTMSAMIDCDRIIRPPPPRPCTARHRTRVSIESANPAPAEARVNRPIATRNGQRRPYRSPNLP